MGEKVFFSKRKHDVFINKAGCWLLVVVVVVVVFFFIIIYNYISVAFPFGPRCAGHLSTAASPQANTVKTGPWAQRPS